MSDIQSSGAIDVLVVGGGLAGLSAANRCAQHGLKVILLERGEEERYLCNSRFAAGFLNCGPAYSIRDGEATLKQAIERQTRGYANPVLADVFAKNASSAAAWLGGRACGLSVST